MLADERNVRDIRSLSKRFPNAKLVLAHCAMGHHVRKLRLALSQIADLSNVWFDCSGISETMSIYYTLRTFGASRMMWGGDFSFGATLGRCASIGSNFIGLHPALIKEMPADYHYEPFDNATEGMVALLEAMELLALSDSEREEVFYGTAVKLFG